MPRQRIYSIFLAASLLACPTGAGAGEPVDFTRSIQPILAENCYFCHGPDAGKREADLRLDDHAGALQVMQPGESSASELYRRLLSDDEFERMPPPDSNRKLTREQIDLIRRWIDEGANWGEHWSFTPLARPELPESDGDSPHPIDRFVQARLAREGLKPSPPAGRETLIRRVTLDLTGLPPTPEAVDAFLADDSPEAYEKVVDRLLASPAYGERMAWTWLDAARYADTNGYQGDSERTMWPWRDWVIRAFNENMPFDQFTLWQLAGDLLPDASFEQQLATGFCRNHMINGEGGRIPEENRVEYVFDMTETTGTIWLGLTLNCCRCHDHKYDPLTRKDYYELFAFFNQTPVTGAGRDPQTPPVLAAPTREQQQRIDELSGHLAELRKQLQQRRAELAGGQSKWEQVEIERLTTEGDEPFLTALRTPADARTDEQRELISKQYLESDETYAALSKQVEQAEKQLSSARNAVPKVMVMEDMDEPRQTFMLDVGLYSQPQDEVAADVPGSLPGLPDEAPRNRLGLARWLVSEDNPLPARVTVNRFWQQFFGVGLVNTPEDFGVQGEIPVHMDLLNWLAAEFRENGWDVKGLVRLIVTSRTYRQSSHLTEELRERDPENRLLARASRYRLPSWMLRDQALAASGLLVPRIGGPPVKGYQPPGIWEEATFGKKKYVQDQGEALYRRTLYTFWRRIVAPTMLFDNASRQVCTVTPFLTNTPLHALITLNETTYVESARALAQRVLHFSDDDPERMDRAFRLAASRSPKPEETDILLARLETLKRQFSADPEAATEFLNIGESPRDERLEAIEHAAWAGVCSLILNLDETLTRQ
jgi:hypothetical protein